MRVKITYGVDLEDIPREIMGFVEQVYDKNYALSKQIDLLMELAENEDMDTVPTLIDKLRKTLLDVDSRLADIDAIVKGFNVHKKQGARDVSERKPSVDTTGNNNDEG